MGSWSGLSLSRGTPLAKRTEILGTQKQTCWRERFQRVKKGGKNKEWGWNSPSAFSSIQVSHLVVSDSLRTHETQHTRPPCPSPIPRVYSNSCPLSWRCHPTILSSVVLFSSWLQSFSASGSFPMSQLFASGGQSTGVSASTSVLPMNIQD